MNTMNKFYRVYLLPVFVLVCTHQAMSQQLTGKNKNPFREIQPIWHSNQLFNGNFENGTTNWTSRRGASYQSDTTVYSKAITVDDVSHSGELSLQLSGDGNTNYWYTVESDPIPVQEDTRYKLRGWIKTRDVHQEGQQYLNNNIYLQFLDNQGKVIDLGGSLVRGTERILGTQNWTEVSVIVNAPLGSTQARIGCVLTCSGTSWFDDIELLEGDTITWNKLVSERLIYYYTKEPPPENVVTINDAYVVAIESMLEVQHPQKIRFYKYESKEHKRSITGKPSRAHHEGDDVHSITWDRRHDMVHVLMNPVGRSLPLMEEGIVYYALATLLNKDVHRSAIGMEKAGMLLPISKMLNPATNRRIPQSVSDTHAGSFVSFLIEQWGIKSFKKLYPYTLSKYEKQDFTQRFLQIYGLNLDEAEIAWKQYLDSKAEIVPMKPRLNTDMP